MLLAYEVGSVVSTICVRRTLQSNQGGWSLDQQPELSNFAFLPTPSSSRRVCACFANCPHSTQKPHPSPNSPSLLSVRSYLLPSTPTPGSCSCSFQNNNYNRIDNEENGSYNVTFSSLFLCFYVNWEFEFLQNIVY